MSEQKLCNQEGRKNTKQPKLLQRINAAVNTAENFEILVWPGLSQCGKGTGHTRINSITKKQNADYLQKNILFY